MKKVCKQCKEPVLDREWSPFPNLCDECYEAGDEDSEEDEDLDDPDSDIDAVESY